MLKPIPFANSFAATTLLFYVVLYLLKLLAPPFFELIFNSQFLGANVASLATEITFATFLGAAIAISVVTWIFGWTVAYFYNYFAKKD